MIKIGDDIVDRVSLIAYHLAKLLLVVEYRV